MWGVLALQKLFNYISGANSANAKIEMTAPVLTKIEPGQGPACNSAFTMSFYQPWKYQVLYYIWNVFTMVLIHIAEHNGQLLMLKQLSSAQLYTSG
jgi:hypothetical protein